MNSSPRVSVIIPSYNHSLYIKQTIDSIYSQNYENKEVIILDDGSTDGSVELLQTLSTEFPFRLIIKKNEGLCETLNKGLELATGSYVIIIASDDFLTPNRIEEQVHFLEGHPEVDVLSGSVNFISNDGKYLFTKGARKKGLIKFDDILKRNIIFAPSCMIRRSLYDRFGKYKPNYPVEDFYLWLKVLSSGGQIFIHDKVWANYRYMSGDLSSRFEWYYNGYVHTISDYLPNKKIQSLIERAKIIYLMKLSLHKGVVILNDNKKHFNELPIHYKLLVVIAGVLPRLCRRFLLEKGIQGS